MKVAVYSGEIPSTTFIERLIHGLSNSPEVKVYLFGGIYGDKPDYNSKVTVRGYRTSISQVLLGIRYRLLFFTKPRLWRRFMTIWKPEDLSLKEKLKLWGKVLPVVYAELDIFHIQWAKNLEYWSFLEKLGVKIICSLRGTHINSSPLANSELADAYRATFPKCVGFHAVSKAILREACTYGDISNRSNIVYSGLELADFSFTPKGSLQSPLKIISIGRPHWKKGYNYAFNACKILSDRGFDFSYIIVGGKTEELQYLVRDMGLENKIEFKNRLTMEEIRQAIIQHDLLLLPSVEEGIANVVLESMALGTPVISTDCGGMAEVVEEGVTGFLMPVRDAEAIASKIQHVANLDEKILQEVCRNARQRIESHHQKSKMVEGIIKLYNRMG